MPGSHGGTRANELFPDINSLPVIPFHGGTVVFGVQNERSSVSSESRAVERPRRVQSR